MDKKIKMIEFAITDVSMEIAKNYQCVLIELAKYVNRNYSESKWTLINRELHSCLSESIKLKKILCFISKTNWIDEDIDMEDAINKVDELIRFTKSLCLLCSVYIDE